MKPSLPALIIDDDEDMCHLLKRLLASRGIHAATAHNLKHGLHCMKEVRPKVIFLDNNLPDGSGLNFIKEIKAYDPHIQIIMLTGDTLEGLREDAFKEGVHSFISKPLNYEQLNKTVTAISLSLPLIFFPLLSAFSFFSESA
jgi:DNA-binding NtrC family response regulator